MALGSWRTVVPRSSVVPSTYVNIPSVHGRPRVKETSERTSRARLSFPVNEYKVRRRKKGGGKEGKVGRRQRRERGVN